jgi:hypothetical protein
MRRSDKRAKREPVASRESLRVQSEMERMGWRFSRLWVLLVCSLPTGCAALSLVFSFISHLPAKSHIYVIWLVFATF